MIFLDRFESKATYIAGSKIMLQAFLGEKKGGVLVSAWFDDDSNSNF
jgi:hypothetical protein